jgi:hypothetical protein
MMMREKHKVQFVITFALARGNIFPLLVGSIDPEASTPITQGCQHGFLSNLEKEGREFPTEVINNYSLVSSGCSESANKFATEHKAHILTLPSNADTLRCILSDKETEEAADVKEGETEQEKLGDVGLKSGERQTSVERVIRS